MKMTGNQFKKALKTLGLNQGSAADLLGYQRRQIVRWGSGSPVVPKLVASVLGLMIAGKISEADLR